MPTTHIEVTKANKGEEVYGLKDGHLLKVDKETPKFFFVQAHGGRQIKVSKQTKKACHWGNKNTSPVFNI